MKLLKEHSVFVVLLLVCAVLRFLPLFHYQFTYDELSGLERTQFNSFSEVIEKGVKIDAHPALVQLIIYYTVRWFGYVTWILKLPFLLFSLAAVVYAYALGRKHFSEQVGLLSAALFSFSLIFVYYAPIARMYISGVFFSLALLYYFFEIFFSKETKVLNYFLLGLFAWLSALNQHINSLFAFTVCVSGFFFLNRSNYKAYLLMCVLVVFAYLPHLPVTLYQLSVPGIGRENGGWLEVPSFSVIFSFLRTLFGTGRTWLLFLAAILLAVFLQRKFRLNKKQIFLFLVFVLNFLVIYAYTVYRSPIFQYSVMLFSGSAFVLFVCSLIEFKNKIIFYSVLGILAAVLLYKTYVKKDYFHQCVETVYEYQFARTTHYKQLLGDKNVYPVFFDADNIMKKIYFEKYHTTFACKVSSDSLIADMERANYVREKDPYTAQTVPDHKVSSIRLFSEFISHLDCDYLVLSSAMPQFQAIAKDHFPYLLENTQTQGINYKLYSRKPSDKTKTVEDDAVVYFSSPRYPNGCLYSKAGAAVWKGASFLLKVDSLNEFPFDAKVALSEISQKEGQVTLVKARLKLRSDYSPLEVCVSLTDKNSNEQYAYNAKAASDFVMKDSVVTIYSEQFNGNIYKRARYKANLNAYVWNRTHESAELSEFEIKVIDYWPKKWALWD